MDIPSNKAVKKKKEGNHIEEFKLDEIGASKAQVEFFDWPKSRNSQIYAEIAVVGVIVESNVISKNSLKLIEKSSRVFSKCKFI